MFKSLKLYSFKGCTASHTFGRGNLILGRNFSGKTAIDQAARALVLGYAPDVGKQVSALAQYASDSQMRFEAVVSFDGADRELAIELQKSRGTFKKAVDQTLALEITDQERVLFDPNIFFGLSDNARVAKACELVQSGGGSEDEIEQSICTIVGDDETLQPYLKEWLASPRPGTVNDFIAQAEAYWKDVKKQVNAAKDRAAKTVEGLTDLRANDTEQLPSLTALQANRSAIVAKTQTLSERISRASTLASAAKRTADTRANLEKIVDNLDQCRLTVAELKGQIDEVERSKEEAMTTAQVALAALQGAQRTKTDAVAAANAQARKAPATELRTDDFLTNADPEKRYLATVVIQKLPDGMIDIVSVEDWRELKENDDEADESERMRQYEIEQAISDASDEVDRTSNAFKAVSQQLQTLQRQFLEATRALSQAEQAKDTLATLKDAEQPEDVSEILKERDALTLELRGFDAQIQKITTREHDEKRLNEAIAQRDAAEKSLKTAGKVIERIGEKRTEIVSLSIDKPLAVANKLAAGILKGPLVFEGGEIGMRVGARFVSSRAFSGTESAITVLGLTAGLAARSKLRVVMLDEVGRLDGDNVRTLIGNLNRMVEDRDIDQWIAIGPENEGLAHYAATLGVTEIKL